MFFKSVVTLAVVINVNACPSAKKANLRQEGKQILLFIYTIELWSFMIFRLIKPSVESE